MIRYGVSIQSPDGTICLSEYEGCQRVAEISIRTEAEGGKITNIDWDKLHLALDLVKEAIKDE